MLPHLLESLTGDNVADAAKIGGYLVFVYALMQFLFSPVLGNLVDRFGRRPVLLLSLVGLITDYSIMSFAPSVAYLFFGRMISGISGAAVSTATAYIADITPREKRAQRFGLIGAAFGLGFIIGPVVGGVLGEISDARALHGGGRARLRQFPVRPVLPAREPGQEQASPLRPQARQSVRRSSGACGPTRR